jgi:hypothetical protein
MKTRQQQKEDDRDRSAGFSATSSGRNAYEHKQQRQTKKEKK